MAPKISPSGRPGLEVVLTLDPSVEGDAGKAALLAQALKRAGVPAGVAVCSSTPPLGPTARHILAPQGHSPQAALILAASGSPASKLLFWPADLEPDIAEIRALIASARSFDIVLAPRGQSRWPAWSAGALDEGLHDLGGPCLFDRDTLLKAGAGLGPGDPLLTARVLRQAMAQGAELGQLPAGPAELGPLDALGLVPARLKALLGLRLWGAFASALALLVGVYLGHPALLGLALFSAGLLGLGYYFGKAE